MPTIYLNILNYLFLISLVTSYKMSGFSLSGKSHDSLAEVDVSGKFVRTKSIYREIISNSHSVFKPEFNRYHLYISHACPWANRCLAVLMMKGLTECIRYTVVHPTWQRTKPNHPNDLHCGWAFYQSSSLKQVSFICYIYRERLVLVE